MMRRGLALAILSLFGVDLYMLASVQRDRASDDIVYVTLDERELRLVEPSEASSAIELRFATQRDGRGLAAPAPIQPAWIDQPQLAMLGFDCSISPGDPRATNHYRAQLRRPAAVAFDVGTEVWRRRFDDWSRRVLARAGDVPEPGGELPKGLGPEAMVAAVSTRASRMVPLEVGRDSAALRGKYRGRPATIVLPVVIGIDFDDGTRVHSRAEVIGRVETVYPLRVVVPARLRSVFADVPVPAREPINAYAVDVLPHPPRYEVTLAIGPALRPWVVDARRLAPGAAPR